MSQPQPDDRIDLDPLLAFSIEPGVVSIPPTQPDETIAPLGVSSSAPPVASATETEAALRARIDRLEKALDRSTQEITSLRSEVATLVGVKAEKERPPVAPAPVIKAPIKSKKRSRSYGRLTSAVAGVVLGIASGMWIWNIMTTEPLIPASPIQSAAAEPIIVSPVPPTPVAAPEILPVRSVASVAPVTTSHVSQPRQSSQPFAYVGTLSIDSDPPADVFIDRKSAGRTPLIAPNLKAGSHLVWIERDGYRRFTRVVQVPADRVSRVVADLEPDAQR